MKKLEGEKDIGKKDDGMRMMGCGQRRGIREWREKSTCRNRGNRERWIMRYGKGRNIREEGERIERI